MGKRGYDNALRRRKSQENQKLIIQTLIELLVEKNGGEVTFEAIAKRAKISERTIYRFFKDKAALHREMENYIASFLNEGYERLPELDIPTFGKYAFTVFDKHHALTIAYLLSPFGFEARREFRKRLSQGLSDKIKADYPHTASAGKEHRLAFITALISARLWHDLHVDFGYSGEEMGETVSWAISTLLNHV